MSTGNDRPTCPKISDRIDLSDGERISVELASRRTGMSFQQTRMTADSTLMSIMRTSLALIGFGFTIFQAFSHLRDSGVIAETSTAPQNFGRALVVLGILMLALGIGYHVRFMVELRRERTAMVTEGLIHGDDTYPVSLTLLTAGLLLLLGIAAIVSMVFNARPFG